jgi:acyl-CoA synthetase (AMP-forming)/AMP-acid ligase II
VNLVLLLTAQAAARPDAVAIIDRHAGRDRATTFAELDRQTRQGAAFLRAAGLGPGDRILMLHRMSAELYVALISAWRAGMTAVFVDISTGFEDLNRCCATCKPAAFLGSAKAHLLRLVSGPLRRIPRQIVLGGRVPGVLSWSRASNLPADESCAMVDDETPALMTFTSGSTGQPKAAVRTHGFLRAQYESLQEVLHLEEGEVDLTTLPIVALANLASGVTSVIADADLRRPGAIDPIPVIEQLERHRVTRAAGSPALFDRVADQCLASNRTLPGIKRIFTGGGPVFPGLLDRLQRIAPVAGISAVYGSSEAEPIAYLSSAQVSGQDRRDMMSGHGLLAGVPVSTVQLRILRDPFDGAGSSLTSSEFDARCLAPGTIGEIAVSGRHVLTGYLDGWGDTETKVRAGDVVWHRTGDAGYLDAHGRVWLLGRCAAKVVDRRGVVYPFAVECAAQHDNVRRAALVAKDGRRLLLLERCDRRQSVDVAALRESLAWASIDSIGEYPRLPVDHRHNAKIDYPALRRLVDRTPAATIG